MIEILTGIFIAIEYRKPGLKYEVQRAPSSISRELRRNGWRNPAMAPKKQGRPPVAGGYRAPLAQQRADALTTMVRGPARLGAGRSLVEPRGALAARAPFARADRRHTATHAPGRADASGQSRDDLHGALRHAAGRVAQRVDRLLSLIHI